MGGWGDRGGWGWYPPSKPRKAKGGIRSQSKRGTFGESWWARRWLRVLEGFQIGARLERGRRYARGGQVLSIDVERGLVRARVQGSRPKPYDITIQVRTIEEADWGKLAQALARQALFAAKLLAGEMPQEIEQVFEEVGLSLFPAQLGDLSTKCSCPDWSNPCKHIAAVYYLLGEEFDRDPFLIFALRGLSHDELLARLGEPGPGLAGRVGSEVGAAAAARIALPHPAASRDRAAPPPKARPKPAPEPLTEDPAAFWNGAASLPDDWLGTVEPPPVAAPPLRRLGGFPFWRSEQPFRETLEPVYTAASPRGLDVLLGQAPGNGPSPSEPARRPRGASQTRR